MFRVAEMNSVFLTMERILLLRLAISVGVEIGRVQIERAGMICPVISILEVAIGNTSNLYPTMTCRGGN
jgi:hypothetical protein